LRCPPLPPYPERERESERARERERESERVCGAILEKERGVQRENSLSLALSSPQGGHLSNGGQRHTVYKPLILRPKPKA
jgi:hypothetical protein